MPERAWNPVVVPILLVFLLDPLSASALAGPGGEPGSAEEAAGPRASLPSGWEAVEPYWWYENGEFRSRQNTSDLNGDGYIDLVVLNRYDGSTHRIDSYVYWGSANGFSDQDRTALPTMGAHGIGWGDLDRDGHIDLVFSNLFDDVSYNIDSYIYWGSDSGYSASDRTGLPTHAAVGVSVADLDNDGWDDLVFSNWYDGQSHNINSYIYWGSGSGFSTANRLGLPTMGAVANSVADLDNDGYLDIVFSNQYDGSSWTPKSYIYWGSASGFSSSDRTSLSTKAAYGNAVGDLNRDGFLDIVFSCEYDGSSYNTDSHIYWGSVNGFSDGNRALLPTRGAHECSIADLNADGWPDVVFSNFYNGASHAIDLYIYWGSSGGFSTARRLDLPASGSTGNVAEDFDGDGWLDLFVSNFLSDPANYKVNSYLYYGASFGFTTGNRAVISSTGAIGAGAACGAVGTAETTFGSLAPRPFPLAINGSEVGENYTFIVDVKFAQNPGYRDVRGGAVFGYVDEDNYHCCVLEERPGALAIYKTVGGRTTRVCRMGGAALDQNVFYNLTLDIAGTCIRVYLNGSLEFGMMDGNLAIGRVGLLSGGGEVHLRPDIRPMAYLVLQGGAMEPPDASENDTVALNATLRNPGYGWVRDRPVELRAGEDFSGAVPVGEKTVTVPPRSGANLSLAWKALGGPQTIWVAADGEPLGFFNVSVNRYPSIERIPDQRLYTEMPCLLQLNGSDPDGDPLDWSTDTDLFELKPAGDRNALISFTPGDPDIGRHLVTITATDPHGKAATVLVNFTVIRTNHQPVIGEPLVLVAYEDEPFDFTVNATDPDLPFNDTIWFQDDCGLFDIEPSSGRISFTPRQSDVGTYLFNISAFDRAGRGARALFSLQVKNTNDPPMLEPLSTVRLDEDSRFSMTVNASDPDTEVDPGEVLMFSASGGLFTINPMTGVIDFSPRQKDVGTHRINITVTDRAGVSDTRELVMVIANVNDPPALAEIPPLSATEDLPFEYNLSFSDEDWSAGMDNLTFGSDSAFFPVDAAGKVRFTPTNDLVGDHYINVSVTDSGGLRATRTVHLSVANVNDAPTGVRILAPINGTRIPFGQKAALVGSGTDIDRGDVLTFTWLDNGKLLGTGAELQATLKPGRHRLTLEVSDGNETVTAEVTVVVDQATAGGPDPMLLAVVAVVVAALITMVAFLALRRRRTAG